MFPSLCLCHRLSVASKLTVASSVLVATLFAGFVAAISTAFTRTLEEQALDGLDQQTDVMVGSQLVERTSTTMRHPDGPGHTKNSALADEMSAAAVGLRSQAQSLVPAVSMFKIAGPDLAA